MSMIHSGFADRERVEMLTRSGTRIKFKLRDLTTELAAEGADLLRRHAPYRTGNLQRSAGYEPAKGVGGWYQAESFIGGPLAQYARAVDEGTGIWGPSHMPIRATPGNIFTFMIDGKTINTRTVKGQRAQEYVEKVFRELNNVQVPLKISNFTGGIGNL